MSKRRVVVTGIGAVTPLGNDVNTFWKNIKDGVCGINEITLYDTSNQKVKIAAEVKNFNANEVISTAELRRLDRSSQFALVAAVEAFNMSGIDMSKEDPYRCGTIISSGIGGLKTIETECLKGGEKGFDRVSPYYIPMAIANMPAGNVAIKLGLQGMCTCPVTACAGGTNAIGDALRHVRDGYAEVMLCGGTEAAITSLGLGGFTSLRALSLSEDVNSASIPFDARRNGFVMGEGAGILVLEEYEHAKKRGANIIAEIVGYGTTCDAHHITAPLEDGSGASNAMKMAIQDAKINKEEIGYINAHGTSTPLNDAGETKAIKLAFDEHAYGLCISSTKSMTGHLLGASGAVEGIITVLSVKEGFAPPTINYKEKDPECDLDITPNKGRDIQTNYAMSNSLGFGGHNASIIFKKYTEV